MDYLDLIDQERSYEDRVCEAEFRAESQRENEQIKYLEERDEKNGN